MDLSPNELTKRVKKMMSLGFAPSEIDRMLDLRKNTAHDIVLAEWRKGRSASMNEGEL